MYMSSISSFAASWLLFCLIIPFCSGTERSDSIPYEINNSVYREFRPIQPIVLEKQLHPSVPKPPQYNVYHKHNLVQPEISPTNIHLENNVKQNVVKSMPDYQLREVYRPYYYPQFIRNQETLKKDNTARLEREGIREIDEEIMKKMNMLDTLLSDDSDENDIKINDTVEDEIIAEMNISEETKRVVRQVRRHRPGFFWTLARLAFETYNDTRSAIQQINNIISENIELNPTTRRPASSHHPLMVADARTIAPSVDQNNTSSDMAGVNVTTTTPTTTTETSTKLSSTDLQSLIRRNLRGLVRLFNIEWQDAMNQSEINVREFQKDLGNQIGSFLQDNPNAY